MKLNQAIQEITHGDHYITNKLVHKLMDREVASRECYGATYVIRVEGRTSRAVIISRMTEATARRQGGRWKICMD